MLVTWSPWQELNRLEQAMNQVFENGRAQSHGKVAENVPTWQPAVDVFEDATKIVLVADLPGVEEKDLELSVDKNILTVKGGRKPGGLADDVKRRLERAQGNFSRAFALPQSVDMDNIRAELKSGVLTLTLTKKPEAQPRQIKVTLGS